MSLAQPYAYTTLNRIEQPTDWMEWAGKLKNSKQFIHMTTTMYSCIHKEESFSFPCT